VRNKKRKIEDRKKPQGKNVMSASATQGQGGHNKMRDNCSLLGANSNQWRPVKYIITIQPPMFINGAQETYWALFFHM